jgi:hypothetical protein
MRCMWKDDIKLNLRKINCENAKYVEVTQVRVQVRVFMATVKF